MEKRSGMKRISGTLYGVMRSLVIDLCAVCCEIQWRERVFCMSSKPSSDIVEGDSKLRKIE